MKKKVAVGLSGGVDSAVSAYLLKKQGFDISGVYLDCFDEDAPGCRGKQDRQDALGVALNLKISFQVLDFRKQYKSAVIAYFKKEYLAGRTPNPDVICNRDIKFGLLLDWCIKNGFDYMATGHYAKLMQNATVDDRRWKVGHPLPPSSIFHHLSSKKLPDVFLIRPLDEHKDQTYFLWAVPREKFSRVLFPLANFTKKDTRSLAKLSKIPVADKPDSTGICFVGEVRVEDFLKRLGIKEKIGEVVTSSGQVIGRHRGVWFYTIGQRHGFEITRWPVISSPFSVVSYGSAGFQSFGPEPINRKLTNHKQKTENRKQITDKPPLYVISKDVRRNRLIVGFGPECYRSQFTVSQINWLIDYKTISNLTKKAGPFPKRPGLNRIFVRLRHLGDLIPCSLSVSSEQLTDNSDSPFTIHRSQFTVHLRFAQRGIAPGQSAVFYSKEGVVLGGGVIQP